MSYLTGENRRRVREQLFDVVEEQGGAWMRTREVARAYHERRLWEVPRDPYLSHEVATNLLNELRAQERVERRRLTPHKTEWRVPPAPPVPDTLPVDWTRELVPA